MKNSREGGPFIERMRVPNEDAHNWVRTLQEGGFTSEEIDALMIHLNDEYAARKIGKFVEEETELMAQSLERRGRKITEEQRAELRKVALEHLRKISPADLEKGIRVSYDDKK